MSKLILKIFISIIISNIQLNLSKVYDCSDENEKIECDSESIYRTIDGSCNNLIYKWWGKSFTPYQRLLKAEYDDDDGAIRTKSKLNGHVLPNPRSVSLAMHYSNDKPTFYTDFFIMFGQLIAQDVTGYKESTNNKGDKVSCSCDLKIKSCNNIPTPAEDNINADQECMTLARSEESTRLFDCDLGYREQINIATSWTDLSNIYGTTLEASKELRLFKNGLLKSSHLNSFKKEYFIPEIGLCRDETSQMKCFKSGAKRVNQNLLVVSQSLIWLREHNRIAKELFKLNPNWDDNKLFEEARRIVIAQYQKIIYYDWLPIVVDKKSMKSIQKTNNKGYYLNYSSKAFPQTFNEFGASIFRFGHTMLRSWIQKSDRNLRTIANISINDIIYRPVEAFENGGLDALFIGMLKDSANKFDPYITEELENHLFENFKDYSNTHRYSLSSLSISRSRDHGIAPYNKYRKLCGLKLAKSFDDLNNIPKSVIKNLKSVYQSVDDIDLYTGALSETPLDDTIVGKTVSCIIAYVFDNLKRSDRFFFQNGHDESTRLSVDQLKKIMKVDIKSIICRNVDLVKIQTNPFMVYDEETNVYINCKNVSSIDFRPWKEKTNNEEDQDVTAKPQFKFNGPFPE